MRSLQSLTLNELNQVFDEYDLCNTLVSNLAQVSGRALEINGRAIQTMTTCARKVGEDNFFQLLRHYIHDLHHGKLVHSTDFLALYFEEYPLPNKSSNESIQETCLNWLDTDILPAWIGEKYQSIGKKQVHEKNTGF